MSQPPSPAALDHTGQVPLRPDPQPHPCPLPPEPVPFDRLTPALCRTLEQDGCPVAAAVLGRIRFETLLTELSARFVNLPPAEVDAHIDDGLRLIVETLGFDRSGLAQVAADGRQFVITHSYQLPGVPPSARLILHDQFPTYSAMLLRGQVVRLPHDLPADAGPEWDYLRRTGMAFHLAIPLTVMGTVVGGLGLASFRAAFEPPNELVPRLRLLGDIFANALARKRADEALRLSEEHLRLLTARLLHAQEEERRRLAREMHDDWSQRLAILGLETARLEPHLGSSPAGQSQLRAIQEHLVSLSEDVHALSRQLHPSILDDLGLAEAVRSECAGFSRRTDITVHYLPENVPSSLPHDVALGVYRIAQEALRNVAKHARAAQAWVTLRTVGPELVLQVRDQGRGFDPTARPHAGLGLSSMEERTRLIRGRLTVTSSPGRGATVEVRIPLHEGQP